ncbi:hypothetical protein F4818DRAFT_376840 [Hypoxylon cercidicola]|nr:hypothetical protein F4818DRAFT_376840 [Hypoxylon cercidicola]
MESRGPLVNLIRQSVPRRRVEKSNFDRTFPRETEKERANPKLPNEATFEEFLASDTISYSEVEWPGGPQKILTGVNILQGAEQIMNCTTDAAVGEMMDPANGLFGAYSFYALETWFNQAAATMDGGWAVTWLKICLGIVRFAEEATEPNFWRLVYDCHLQDRLKRGYDALDFLLDLGLTEEARVVQSRWESRVYEMEQLLPFLNARNTPNGMRKKLRHMNTSEGSYDPDREI